jgi:putative ABC transport system ATP-binding protein
VKIKYEEAVKMSILEVHNLKKVYITRFGGNHVQALTNVSFSVEDGEYVAIMGESGSGKTTLLNILAALDKPTSGEVLLNGKSIVSIKEKEISAFRRDNLGFVFQDFNLLDTFSLKDNIFLPLVLAGEKYEQMNAKLEPLARKLGIGDILAKYPYEVSGGQKQRAAVARALITDPKLVLADEPTGALDSRATEGLLRVFNEVNAEGQTILMVTHSVKAASHAGRVLFIKDGEVFHQIYRANMTEEEMYQKISDTLTVIATGGDQNE